MGPELTLLRYTRRPARELTCPHCGGSVRLLAGALQCIGDGTIPPQPCGSFDGLYQLAVGPRLTPDCHLTALACFHRRTRECVRWEVETGRRMVGKGRAS